MSKEIQKHILEFFKIQQLLGSGAYGHVWKAKEISTHKTFALKKVFDAFQNEVDSQRTYREITILHQLNHNNIIKLKGVIKAQNDKDLYLVFQHMQTDLHSLVGQNILEMPHLLYIIYQIFKALKYLHSAQLIHRDLKPSNVLINSDCDIKLCDFGLVRSMTHQQNSSLILSEDVATRWYRSPQMLLGSQQYSWATDVWSVGCILAQLMIGEPILMGGSNIQQLEKILQLTGIPKKQDINSIKSPAAQPLIQQFRIFKKPFKLFFKGSKFQGQTSLVNLVKRMLQFNPQKRITVNQVLGHELFQDIRSKTQQKICSKVIIPQIDDNIRLSIDQYRKSIYKDIERRYPAYNKVQLKQVQFQPRYQRGHNSLLNRTSSNPSLNKLKQCNSLFRPTRTKVIYKQNNNLSLHNKSVQNPHNIHSNTIHSSYFYKKSHLSNHKDQTVGSSFYKTKNPLGQISNKQKLQCKQSTDASTVVEKSPFRKYKKYQMYLDSQQLAPIQGLQKQNQSIEKQKLQKNQNFMAYISLKRQKFSHPNKIKTGIYDPSAVYTHSPSKKVKSKQKNVYQTVSISNENKIVKKTFNRKKKQLIFQKNRDPRNSINFNTGFSNIVAIQ